MRDKTATGVARAVLLLLFVLLAGNPTRAQSERESSFTIHFETSAPNRLAPGVTFGHDQTDNSLTRQALEKATAYQNQHIIGWGGWYTNDTTLDLQVLDERVNRMSGPDKVITLCCALPDQRVDPSSLESRPRSDAFDAFAAMAGRVARRFAGEVRYYQVWNEMKGFWLNSDNRWDYGAYCTLYNKVYDEVKRADPTAMIGGPYVTMDVDAAGHEGAPVNSHDLVVVSGVLDSRGLDVVEHWLDCARTRDGRLKGDFLVVDVRNFNRQNSWPVDGFTANEVFEQVAGRLREQLEADGIALPIWAAEWYSTSPVPLSAAQSAALQMSAMRSLALGGYTKAPLWYPEGNSEGLHDLREGFGPMGLWTRNGESTTPLADYFEQFKLGFPVGGLLYSVEKLSGSGIQVLAGETKTMLINTRDDTAVVNLDSARLTLKPYEVRFIDTAVTKLGNGRPLP